MKKKQLAVLFICNAVPWIVGNGLFALLPIYAVRLGADSASIGNYLALAFFAVTVGTIGAGWLSNKFGRHKVFIIAAGIGCCGGTWLMSLVTEFWQLIPLTCIVWFCAGVLISMTTIVAGLFAEEAERGKIFGILGLNVGIGALIGGAMSGRIVDRWGYSALFILAAFGWLIPSLVGLLLQDPVQARQAAIHTEQPALPKVALGNAFHVLMLAAIAANIPGFIINLGRPLLMDKMGFDPAEISGVVAIGGAVSLPFPFILGWLSGRIGYYRLIAFCYVLVASGLAIMIIATALWQFWVSAIFLAIAGSAGIVGLVLVGELVPRAALSSGLAQYGATGWIGAIIGLSGAGYALKLLGANTTFVLGVALALIAIVLVVVVRNMRNALAKAIPIIQQE
ncbi:MAG: MFS transporter [Aggregatilineales bacterium]